MTTSEIPDVAVWAAAETMYGQRPANTDPKHWETPWGDVPEKWKKGQYRAASRVLEAAFREGKRAERLQNRGNTAKTGSSEENTPLSAPVTLPASVYQEALAAAWDIGYQTAKYGPHTTNPFRQETPLSNNCTVGKHDACPANHTPITCHCPCHIEENQS